MQRPRILIGCETSGVLRRAFQAAAGDRARIWSCDLLPAEDNSPFHLQRDLLSVLDAEGPWDLMVAHPPCTYLCRAGIHWNSRVPGRAAKTEEALEFFKTVDRHPNVCRSTLENPIGVVSTRYRRHDQTLHPWQFGHDAEKTTNLWLRDLPPVEIDPALRVPGRIVNGKERWSNQTDSGQNRLSPGKDRWKERSRTYPGIAEAMVKTWLPLILK